MTRGVVIADQSHDFAHRLAGAFIAAGYQVLAVCHDGVTALAEARRLQPTVMTIDLLLPRLNGLEVARALDKLQLPTRLIVITAVTARHRVVAARAAGAASYVLKPADPERIVDVAGLVSAQELDGASHAG